MARVAIIGGGPVGLGLAIDLALRGVPSHVLERSTELHAIPKGQNLTQRTGEHLRAWGVGEEVRKASPIPRSFGNAGMVSFGSVLSDYRYDWFQRQAVDRYYFAQSERLPQYELERVLRARAIELPEITFETGADVVSISQDREGCKTTFTRAADGERRVVEADFAVGCDGARSITRQLAGIEQIIDHRNRKMVLLVFRSTELHKILERFPGKTIFNVMHPELEGYWQFMGRVDLDGGWFFHAPVPDDTTTGNFDFRAYLHRFVGAEFSVEFEHIGFWDLRISLANDYRAGRIFIAGDAAHSHPPYGGYGVNTGLEDARNLSWKLWAEIEGWAGPELLHSYTTERHAVFASTSVDFIARMIEDFRDFTAKNSPVKDREGFEKAWAARAADDDVDVTEFLPNYAGSPIVAAEPGAKSGAKGQHSFVARPGHHLAPQRLPDGSDLWSSLAEGFTLLDLSDRGEIGEAFEMAAQKSRVPLKVIRAPSAPRRKVYGCEAVLIRPDLFVAWSGPSANVDVEKILSIATGHWSMPHIASFKRRR